ncbi:polyunsaturated fatty acid lipoxygenase ALOX15B-like [Rhea pennata]|uniref:polyunsaturated fatty acid lipoxygenase ALOX15B-like n=1 Tax=Rhea pennata TaxID=8795 RepID=UPI002E260821
MGGALGSLGEPLLPGAAADAWFCACAEVTWEAPRAGPAPAAAGPAPVTWVFPCYRWLRDGCVELREGSAATAADDATEPLLREQRRAELGQRRAAFQWEPFAPGWPRRLAAAATPQQLPPGQRVGPGRAGAFAARVAAGQIRVRLRGLSGAGGSWSSFEHIGRVLGCPPGPVADYVKRHWRDDAFFGYQFLNGVNPVLLRRCPRLPPNFAVTSAMVAPTLGPHTSLEQEMERGTLFLADFGLLDGIGGHRIAGEPQFVAAPLCLLHLRPTGALVPLAIQLSQTPGPDAPVFVPTDAPWDWLLAKLWVRCANFQLHEMVTHLLQSHFLAEVFTLATLRCLPSCHPLYKLLLPHGRFTFHINIMARETLLNPGGVIDQATAIGRAGTLELVARATAALSYAELCVPEDLERRGVTTIPGYYYRDDALSIWGAIESFVAGIVALYYREDSAVRDDPELQDWVDEIFTNGVLGNKDTGFPTALHSRPELVKFLTTIIFCCSARHAAVNSGQYDFAAWMPNTPATMRRPPPRAKGQATAESVLATLPSAGATGALLALLSVVSYEPGDLRPLGCYPEEHFTEEAPRRLIAAFQRRLARISRDIRARNAGLALPYAYLDPAEVQNSVSI